MYIKIWQNKLFTNFPHEVALRKVQLSKSAEVGFSYQTASLYFIEVFLIKEYDFTRFEQKRPTLFRLSNFLFDILDRIVL